MGVHNQNYRHQISEQTEFNPRILSTRNNDTQSRVGRNPFSERTVQPSVCLTEDSEYQPMNQEYASAEHIANMKYAYGQNNNLSTQSAGDSRRQSKQRGFFTCLFLVLLGTLSVLAMMKYLSAKDIQWPTAGQQQPTPYSVSLPDFNATATSAASAFRSAKETAAQKAANAAEKAKKMDAQECYDNLCFFSLLGAITAFIGIDVCNLYTMCSSPGRCCGDDLPEGYEHSSTSTCNWWFNCCLHTGTLAINSFTFTQLCCKLHGKISEATAEETTYEKLKHKVEDYIPSAPAAEVQPPAAEIAPEVCTDADKANLLPTTPEAAPAQIHA